MGYSASACVRTSQLALAGIRRSPSGRPLHGPVVPRRSGKHCSSHSAAVTVHSWRLRPDFTVHAAQPGHLPVACDLAQQLTAA